MKYLKPEIEVMEFEVEDVITSSWGLNEDDEQVENSGGEIESPVMPTSMMD